MSHRAMNTYICVHKSDKYTMLPVRDDNVNGSCSVSFRFPGFFSVAAFFGRPNNMCEGYFVRASLKSLSKRQAVHIPLYPCI